MVKFVAQIDEFLAVPNVYHMLLMCLSLNSFFHLQLDGLAVFEKIMEVVVPLDLVDNPFFLLFCCFEPNRNQWIFDLFILVILTKNLDIFARHFLLVIFTILFTLFLDFPFLLRPQLWLFSTLDVFGIFPVFQILFCLLHLPFQFCYRCSSQVYTIAFSWIPWYFPHILLYMIYRLYFAIHHLCYSQNIVKTPSHLPLVVKRFLSWPVISAWWSSLHRTHFLIWIFCGSLWPFKIGLGLIFVEGSVLVGVDGWLLFEIGCWMGFKKLMESLVLKIF